MMKKLAALFYSFLLLLVGGLPAQAQQITFPGSPEIVMPHLVSTENVEIKVTISPEGKRMLWGTIGWQYGKGGWDIWESTKQSNGWSAPVPASFNSEANDFDPFFSPDGKGVYFFSNRAGGHCGDDLYYVAFDDGSGSYGQPVNLGAEINSNKDEWGPVLSPDGKKLMYCTDGKGGKGKHDIFVSKRKRGKWGKPVALDAINSELDDFDPVFLPNGAIVFASERQGADVVKLYISYFRKGAYSTPQLLPDKINRAEGWVFGCSIDFNDPHTLYYNTYYPENTVGKIDIYKISYEIK